MRDLPESCRGAEISIRSCDANVADTAQYVLERAMAFGLLAVDVQHSSGQATLNKNTNLEL